MHHHAWLQGENLKGSKSKKPSDLQRQTYENHYSRLYKTGHESQEGQEQHIPNVEHNNLQQKFSTQQNSLKVDGEIKTFHAKHQQDVS